MRVVHLSTSDIRGGAARGAYWLHRALAGRGVDSRMLVGRKYGDDDDVLAFPAAGGRAEGWLRARLDRLPLGFYRKTDESFWTVGWLPRRIAGVLRRLAPDIVHVHWTGGGFLPVQAMAGLGVPAVWTLRDMWSLTGGCHYSLECDRYRTGCGRCPQLRSDREGDLSRFVFRRKQASWHDLAPRLVPISRWLADEARASPLLQRMPIRVIPNGIDTGRFRPAGRALARRAWDIPDGRRCILFGALDAVRDRRKGFTLLVEALRLLERFRRSGDTEVLVFGDLQPDAMPDVGLPVRFLGPIADDLILSRLYEAADVMVAPSVQEAFGKTLVEAMACGTPVVAFDHGGPADIVEHGATGYLARAFCPEDLARGIAWCIDDDGRNAELGRQARRRAESEFDIGVVAGRYEALYEEMLGAAACRA